MIKVIGSSAAGRTMLLLGLSRKNTERLHAGQPISFETEVMDPRLPAMTIVIFAGETEDAMEAELRAHLGGAG